MTLMLKRTILLLGIIVFVVLNLCSCIAGIEDTAANSASSIIAVLFEYIFAIVVVLISFIHRLIRSLSIATIILGVIGVLGIVDLSISPLILIAVGVAMLFSFAIPIKPYYPQVIISKNVKKIVETRQKSEEKKVHESWLKELILDLVVGVILLLIEYSLFSN